MHYVKQTAVAVKFDETTLNCGDSIDSPNNKFSLVLEHDGDLVLYDYSNEPHEARWFSMTNGTNGSHVVFQGDGNMVMYNDRNQSAFHNNHLHRPVWDSNTSKQGMLFFLTNYGDMGIIGKSNYIDPDLTTDDDYSSLLTLYVFEHRSKGGGSFELFTTFDSTRNGQELTGMDIGNIGGVVTSDYDVTKFDVPNTGTTVDANHHHSLNNSWLSAPLASWMSENEKARARDPQYNPLTH